MTSNANDLTERLRRRLETERREIEELTAGELERLGENSRRGARNALRTIERDTEEVTGRMCAMLLRAWLRPLVVGLSVWLGICAGSWATMHWLWTRIQARIETAAELDFDIEEARQTLAQLEVDTWGIALLEIAGERVVVLPSGTLDNPRWTWRERQLTAALKRLSLQCEMERRQQSEQVEALRQQVERALDLTRPRGRKRDSGPSR